MYLFKKNMLSFKNYFKKHNEDLKKRNCVKRSVFYFKYLNGKISFKKLEKNKYKKGEHF